METNQNRPEVALPPPVRPEIERVLEDILQSPPFRTSRQCKNLFKYIVEHSLAGTEESLRERIIGLEVFGRATNYDTSEDPVVRLRATDIRKRLAQYYQSHQADPPTWKIEIPTGSYKAQFCAPETRGQQPDHKPEATRLTQATQVGPDPFSDRQEAVPTPTRCRVLLLSGVALVAVMAFLVLTRTISQASSAIDQFWDPLIGNPKPTLVCTGINPVYVLSQQSLAKYRSNHGLSQDATPNFQSLVPKDDLKAFASADFLPVKDTYLTVGDAATISQISSLMTNRHHAIDLRFGSDLSFGDLRQGSAVLVGAFNNSWTLNMTDNLRYVFAAADTPDVRVQDRTDTSRSWHPRVAQGKVLEDYAIVSRVVDSRTGSVFVTLAGLFHQGTQSAGDFATNPRLMAEFAKQAPKDWNKKNLQVVLRTTVVNGIPDPPTVVATHYW
jgi:hypothetical protein